MPLATGPITSKAMGVLLLLLGAAADAAEVHRWVDSKGRVHYGDRPPPDAKTQKVEVKTTEPLAETSVDAAMESGAQDGGDPQARIKAAAEQAREARVDRQKRSTEQRADRQKREAECTAARNELARFEQANIKSVRAEGGQLRDMSDAEVGQVGQRLRERVAETCRSGDRRS